MLEQYDASSSPPLSSSNYGYSQSVTMYDADGTAHSATIYFDGAPSSSSGTTVEYLVSSDADGNGGTAQALMAGTLSFGNNGEITGMSAYTPSTEGSTDLADWNAATLSADGKPQMTVNGSPVTLNLGITATGGWQNSPGNAASVGTDASALASMARKEGRVTVPKVEKFWFSFLDTVRTFGRTHEIGTMALYMMRSLRVFTDVDLAPEALKKGKLGLKPHVLPNGAGPVTRIFKRYKERAKREGVRP